MILQVSVPVLSVNIVCIYPNSSLILLVYAVHLDIDMSLTMKYTYALLTNSRLTTKLIGIIVLSNRK